MTINKELALYASFTINQLEQLISLSEELTVKNEERAAKANTFNDNLMYRTEAFKQDFQAKFYKEVISYKKSTDPQLQTNKQ